ncbi:unnamed protein product, partial [Anisakis simplex]|uniref:AMP-binding domain-containing protein n=1 Tax=Anisakis simplex TaxID=6269 RepID=A0A0M3JHH2_ANISI
MSLMNLALQSTQDFRMSPTDCVYQFTNFCFDNSVLEMTMALSNGSSLLIEDQSFSTNAFLKAIVDHNISHALLFPGLVEMFSDAEVEKLAGLRYWIVGAEKLSQRLMDYALRSGVNVIQNYGPTETTAYALSKQMKLFDHANNLGKPIRNAYCSTRKWTSKQKAPLFTTGELLIGGTGLMRGYLNKTPNVGFCVRDSHDEQRMYA